MPRVSCRGYQHSGSQDLWVEIYALRELRYYKLMKRARIVERPFVRLPRRTATLPGDFRSMGFARDRGPKTRGSWPI